MLAYAIHDSGTERMYQYQGRLMTAVLDEHGTALVRNEYESGALVEQLFPNRDLYTYAYTLDPSQRYMDSVVVTLPDRSQRKIELVASVPEPVREP